MGSRRPPSAPEWQVIIEEMRSQNRATLEAVEAFRESIEERIERLDRESGGRDEVLALAVRDLRSDVRLNAAAIAELKSLSQRHAADIAELRSLSQKHAGDIAELRSLSQVQVADIAELRSLSLQNGGEISELKTETRGLKLGLQENTLELRALSQRVDALNQLDRRVAALERKVSERDSPV